MVDGIGHRPSLSLSSSKDEPSASFTFIQPTAKTLPLHPKEPLKSARPIAEILAQGKVKFSPLWPEHIGPLLSSFIFKPKP